MPKIKRKPTWPHAKRTGVKMSAHPNGQWCKKVDGKLRYFGPWSDPDGALARFLATAENLYSGIEVDTSPRAIVTVADVFNEYLNHRRPDVSERRRDAHVRDKAMGPAMFRRYVRAGESVVAVIGRSRAADSLTPRDFAAIKNQLDDRLAVSTLSGYLTTIRSVFTHAYETGLIANPPKFGPDFRAHGLKRATRRTRREKGKKFISPPTLHQLMSVASVQVRAQILLGINCGFYSVDCSDLTAADIDFDDAIIRMVRVKTETDRACPLWGETIDAIHAAIAIRPTPMNPEHHDRLFITKRGRLWSASQHANYSADGETIKTVTHNDYLAQEFRRLYSKTGIERPAGCGFSWLRHSFYTVARRTKDYDAVNAIMGHAAGGMVEHYLEDIEISELRAVTDHVHDWLFNVSR